MNKAEEWTTWGLRLIVPAMLIVIWTRSETLIQKINDVEKRQAVIEGKGFTSADMVAMNSSLDSKINTNDRRITRLEDAMIFVKESLKSIESKIDAIKLTNNR